MHQECTTPETQLKAIIEAQERGGCDKFTPADVVADPSFKIIWLKPMQVLEILLDPAGLKAAYGDKFPDTYTEIGFEGQCTCKCHECEMFWAYVGTMIARSWMAHSDGRKTVQLAYDLLPRPPGEKPGMPGPNSPVK